MNKRVLVMQYNAKGTLYITPKSLQIDFGLFV